MWIFTTLGFFSVVAKHDEPGTVMVRARTREDLEALVDRHLPGAEILESPHRDYRWRILVGKDEWSRTAQRLAADIDYTNFKDAVADRQGHERARRYGRVWEVMYGLQHAAANIVDRRS